jgi:protein-tyrosine kinase
MLRAQCESCATAVDVAADELFGFDTACPRCAGVLLILDEDEEPADGPLDDLEPAPPLEPAPFQDIPTREDSDLGSPFASPRPAPRSPLEVDPTFYDRPTKADSEEDPYVAAAAALDSTVTGKRTRPSSGRLRRTPDPRPSSSSRLQRVEPSASGRLQRVEGSGRARLIQGTHTGAPPLPAWDDLDALSAAARVEPSSISAPPLADGLTQADDESGELEELAPMVEVPATVGRGSRTYDHPGSSEVGGALGPVAGPTTAGATPPGTTSRPSARARRTGSSTRIPRPRGTGPHARPPTGGRLFGEDLDWLALIDDNLPELDIPDDTGAPRVLVRLPETAAPTAEADAAQIDRFKTAVTALEQGGATAIAELLGAGPPATAAASAPRADSRPAKRFTAGTEDPPSMSPVADDDSATTRPLGAAVKQDESGQTRPLPKPEEDDTRGWEERERRAAADETPRKHPSGRGAQAQAGAAGRRVVEEFRHADLDPALVCARDAASVEADDFRQLYQRIFHPPGDREAPRVILVTSPDPGAGKTAVAANLAIVAARMPGRSAVLVDADPRGRGVLRSFGLRQRMEGLLEALQTHQDPTRSVVQFALGNLDVVPLGIPGSDAAELVASERMASFLARTREAFPTAVVIVDGSSVLHAADPLVLARNVDGVVLVARAGQTPREEVRRAVELLGPGRVLGVVLNGAAA